MSMTSLHGFIWQYSLAKKGGDPLLTCRPPPDYYGCKRGLTDLDATALVLPVLGEIAQGRFQ